MFQATANGSSNTFTLGSPPISANTIIVSANGVIQYDYSVSGVNLTFSSIKWELAGFFSQTGWLETYITTTNAVVADASIDFVIRQQIPEMGTLEFLTSIFQMRPKFQHL